VADPAHIRDEFLLDPEVVFLNHGSFGSCPREVFERYQAWQVELERRPVEFLARRLPALLADARAALGAEIGADPDDLVFVPNATSGVNVAAQALDLRPGDEVLATDLEYGALDLMWRHVCARARASYVRAEIPLPLDSAEEVIDAVWRRVTPRTRVLFLSHITSSTALILPVEELSARARDRGLTTIVDGAHAPGQIPLDLRLLDVDFYAGNCHKWLCAPKGAGFVYVRPELQSVVHPLVIGWGYGDDPTFVRRHELQGTRDPSAYLAVPTAIEWLRAHAWEEVRRRCRELTRHARDEIPLEPVGAPELLAGMVAWFVPDTAPLDLQERLYDDYRIEIPVVEQNGRRLIRASFHAYNSADDLTALRAALELLLV
jgi:isopenicillin-N epimerase